MITLISGGTGAPKLLQGLKELIPQKEITVIANTGEDTKNSGLYVSPDLDTVVYTLADLIDDENWYGIKGDSYSVHDMLSELDHEELLKVGDRDRAVQLYRTIKMKDGDTLSEVTRDICQSLGVEAKVLPMTHDRVSTKVVTPEKEMDFQEFWVERGGKESVTDVKFTNSEEADPCPSVIEALNESDWILIGPSNPITSIGPVISIDSIKLTLEENREKVLAVSPIIGDSPVSGPTGVLMRGLGQEVSPTGVANIYKSFVSKFMIHEEDEKLIPEISELDMEAFASDLLMSDVSSSIRLVDKILDILDYPKEK